MAKRKNTGAWLAAGAVFMVFALLAWALPRLVGAAGGAAWLLGGGLLLFGIAAAVIMVLFLRARGAAAALDDETEAGDDIDHAFSSAEARLGAGSATDRKFGRLPLFLVLGPTGSTKSSVISHSGLDPELLAGEVFRADAVVPTEAVNLWYAQGTVIVEAGGRVLDDPPRWARLIRHLRPNRLAAALGRGRQAPRMALLCIGCDEFLKPGAAQSLTATARQLRARLAEASQQLGIPLPVYVLFTRADRLPFFTDYLRNFTTTEAQQVLGATLPLTGDPTGAWAERESHRLSLAFDRIVHSLGLRRLDVLGRETQDEVRAGAYEFPRELRKIHGLAVQFMLDVFRPSQLGVNPFLRGFYFTGVRPIVVNDVAADAAPRPGPSAVDAGATSVFSVHQLQQAAMAAAPPPSGSRRVPQWVFLHRLFRDVILPDEAALGLTAGGTRVDLMRRALLTAAAAACLVFTLGLTFSFAGNRSLVRGSVAAVQGAREVGRIPGTLGSEDLARLDTLREQTARLTTWQRDGRPVRLTWGLYAGDDLQRVLHPLYFARFGDAIWFDARERLAQYLRGLPAQPDENSDFGRAQAALAAHLITTTEFARSTPDQLAPVLAQYWSGTAGDDETQGIVDRQFAFFAAELAHGNPYDAPHDAALVERTQRFLRAFGREAYYNALIYEASSRVPPARYLGARNLVRNDVVVPGAFTLAGWRNVQSNLDSVDELFLRYQWIYGNQPPADKPQREDLAKLYVAEYIRRWQEYLAGGRVEPFTSISDAAAKLSFLGASGSPLFNMLAVASRETAMDSTTQIGRAFQPLHVTVAPEVDARAVTAGVPGYANALTGLASTLNVLASGTPGDAARLQASTAAGDVKREASAIAGAFVLTGDAAATAGSIQRLLLQPANYTDALVSGLPAAAVNAAGSAFCSTYAPVARRFPFSAQATANATVEEVTSIFRTNDGALWAFYQDALESLMTTRGAPRAGARVRAEFRPFFSRAAEFSSALFSSGGGASLVFDFQPDIPAGASEVILQIDSDVQSYSPTMRASRSFDWQADRSRDARLIVVIDGQPVTVASGEGPWAVFRLFNAASSWTGSGPYRVEWRIPGRAGTVVAQVSFESGVPPVLRPGYLAPISRCVSQVSN